VNPVSSGTIVSIQVGHPRQYGTDGAVDPHQQPWVTAFFKQPVGGPVWVTRTNIEGDHQADQKHHGGIDKAVLAYSADHFDLWRQELGIGQLEAGAFGENLTISGLTEGDVSIGDTWRAGDVLFEVSQPRQPCWKLARRWHRSDLVKKVVNSGRTGWYLRVLEEGTLTPGDPVELVERPCSDWTIARANEVFYARERHQEKQLLAQVAELSAAWKSALLG
jgi:MOSC domain-containing protein YiiM